MRKRSVPAPASPPQLAIQPAPTIEKNPGNWMNRIVVGHPMTGLVRVEWMMGRIGCIIPCNWSEMRIAQFMSPYVPLCYQVADAENLIARVVVENDAEWLLLWEHDNIPPADAMVRLNEYMIDGRIPVVGGLYFTKTVPAEPLVYRGIGNSYYADWKLGDKVWCSGIPFGFTLISGKIIREMWKDSPEYMVGQNQITRRIFESPRQVWTDPLTGTYAANSGTSDLEWCKRVKERGYLAKAGFPEIQALEFPFLIDTNIFVKHIDDQGRQFPLEMPRRFIR